MHPFINSADVRDSAGALRERARREGYLFVPGLVPPEAILAARRAILEVCTRHGFLREDTPLEEAIAIPGVTYREGAPEYMSAYDEIQRLESFHALAHAGPIIRMLEALFGEPVLVHPRNIARVMFPQNNAYTTPAHQDYVHIQGTENTWTAWIPLGDCSRQLGGLEVLAGSHRSGVLPVRSAYGAGGLGVETEHLDLDWHGGDFHLGDALFFHSHCVHRGVNNRTADRVRLSVDYRYQGLSQPVTVGSLLPHFNRMTWDEIYQGWERKDLQYYWEGRDLQMAEFTRQWHASAGR
jgi:ectoine hydroxylase-related dioxygenase (phytanoyl-CoA dioxygenase family)